MGMEKKHKKNDQMEKLSFRNRGKYSERRRAAQLKKRLIIVNTALACVVIMIVLVFQIGAINKKSRSADSREKVSSEKSNNIQQTTQPEATETPTEIPITAPVNEGQANWFRSDLDPTKPMVALTFDDGPYSPVTRRIVDVLAKYNGRATFFVVGNRVAEFAETLKYAYDHGNQIGSHTYDHKDLSKMNKKQIKSEITRANREVQKVIGYKTTALRPPYGNINDKMRKTISVPMFYWNLDTQDWKSRNKKAILKQCKSVSDGDVLLMHDLYPTTADAVEKLVPLLVKKGYQLVTIEELFHYKGIDTKAGKVYFSGK